MEELPSRGVRPQLFDDPAIDALVKVQLEMARELWVVKARLAAFEARHGSVEDVTLPLEAEAGLAAEREAFVRRVFGAIGQAVA